MSHYRLHYFPESGNSYKLALMLALCGQPWEPVWTDFMAGQTRSPEWRAAVNEMGEIPVLDIDGERLTQTGAILLRLSDDLGRFGGDRAEILRWLLWDNHKLSGQLATYRFLRAFMKGTDPAVMTFLRKRVDQALAVAEQRLEHHAFVTGTEPTVADVSMCGYLMFPPDEAGYDFPATHPALAAWLTRLTTLPGWQSPYDLMPGPRIPRP